MLLIRPTPFNNLLYCCFGQWACELASPQTSFGVRLSRIHLTSAGRLPVNGPCPCSLRPRYQNEVKCSAFDMEMIFHSHVNKTHFQKRGGAFGLILKVRVFGARKWPIFLDNHSSHNSYLIPLRTVKSAARKSENIGVFTQV